MFFNSGGKLMGAVFSGDKEKIICLGRVQGRLDGCAARIGNRTGRQSSDGISVVWCCGSQMFAGDVAVKILDAVYYCGIALRPRD